ncbi:amino acid/polyamine/organocation transporter (APC superfamily) [Isoptericola sp. CG 20/1183]|uniref:Amino acid/polyamine/organocation transporter (APC superfamily) n=1 Tax=Isoptericola halotolerans TaxID=300560 RepID=A0ABX5EHU0_9MICO|nr:MULTISPECIES: APC family permease [Isoptericola]PRZ04130.1 amino acid/polyamine/organocation transporter (APC superfamily) [Isoptericola sp. CG 20/1183]PRZ10045.1 amino acid/polyamine/organocation transporter (APC superfamily) [Isoptericola halotolerans]
MTQLARRLGTRDAVAIGLGSMIGAGVFAAFGPAAAAVLPAGTGWALLGALAIAGVVAYANATSSAQLAAQYPVAGGTYVYGRERLGDRWGYLAGWGFVVGKTASCAAMALTFAAYAAPTGWERPVAAAAVVALAAVNYRGVTRTARLTRWIVALVLLALATWTAVVWSGTPAPVAVDGGAAVDSVAGGWTAAYGLLQGAGLLFFAFAGYARIATMGEEVRDPRRTIPRAILLALGGAVVVYTVVALTLLAALGLDGIAGTTAPLAVAVEDSSWAGVVVRVGAAAASLGALLALVAGIGRTTLAMAREGDLPRWLSAVHPRFRVPHRAEVTLAAVVVVLVLTVDLRGAIGFSSVGVLLYYAVANAAAFTQTGSDRLYPRWLQVLGLVACVVLVVTLPPSAVLAGLAVFAVGIALRELRLRLRPAR